MDSVDCAVTFFLTTKDCRNYKCKNKLFYCSNVSLYWAGDEVVRYKNGERSTEILRSSGFSNLTFKTYSGYVPVNLQMFSSWKEKERYFMKLLTMQTRALHSARRDGRCPQVAYRELGARPLVQLIRGFMLDIL